MNTAFLSPLIILCLLPLDKGDDLKYEQIAVDSFFEKIYEKKFSGYKVLEFSGQTASRTKEYLGLIYRCEKLDDSLKEKIFEAAPTLNRKIIINSELSKSLKSS